MNKQLWSTSYTFFMAGTCGAALTLTYWAVDVGPVPSAVAAAAGPSEPTDANSLPPSAIAGSAGMGGGGAGGGSAGGGGGGYSSSKGNSGGGWGSTSFGGRYDSTSSGGRAWCCLRFCPPCLGNLCNGNRRNGGGVGGDDDDDAARERRAARRGSRGWARWLLFPLQCMGMNAILVFFWHGTAESLLDAVYAADPTITSGGEGKRHVLFGTHGAFHQSVLGGFIADPAARQLVYVLLKICCFLLATFVCHRVGYFWKI